MFELCISQDLVQLYTKATGKEATHIAIYPIRDQSLRYQQPAGGVVDQFELSN